MTVNAKKGSCGCCAVEFIMNSEVLNVVNCHCDMCRNHNGSSFSTYAVLPFRALEITKGNELIKVYSVGSGQKHFCGKCGTPLYNTNEKYPGACMIFLGTLSSSRALLPKINVWYESKLAWLDDISDISSFPQGIESRGA